MSLKISTVEAKMLCQVLHEIDRTISEKFCLTLELKKSEKNRYFAAFYEMKTEKWDIWENEKSKYWHNIDKEQMWKFKSPSSAQINHIIGNWVI